MQPFQDDKKEYESHCGTFRVSLGFTINELCLTAGISQQTYSSLNNGMLSPISKMGGIKDTALRLAEALQADPEDLWPSYFCRMEKLNGYTPGQVISLFHAGYENEGINPVDILMDREQLAFIVGLMDGFTPKTQLILHEYFVNDLDQTEIADKIGLSNERVRQILLHAVYSLKGKIRYWQKANQTEYEMNNIKLSNII